jgi:hypothetical protein
MRHRGSYIFLDSRLTDGGEVVSLTRWPAALYPQEDSWYSFIIIIIIIIIIIALCIIGLCQ